LHGISCESRADCHATAYAAIFSRAALRFPPP
jgi:hypothetical protein